jgi:hypothetical protein
MQGEAEGLPALGFEALTLALAIAQRAQTGVMLSWEIAKGILRGYEIALQTVEKHEATIEQQRKAVALWENYALTSPCDYWKPIRDGGIALPCNCGKNCDATTTTEEK